MADGDVWVVDLYSEGRKLSNPASSGIELSRKGFGI